MMNDNTKSIRTFAEAELQRMNIQYITLTLIRDKDGISVWRFTTDDTSYVMKCFEKPEHRREISNYQILQSIGVPTLKVIAHTDYSVIIEDIEHSIYRLATMEDINTPDIAAKIALWYKTLHDSGRDYVNTHKFIDEYDTLTLERIQHVKIKTETGSLNVWRIIEENFNEIHSIIMSLPRTLVYTDFHYSNLAVARDGSSALIFDYNILFKSYVYSDIRNVCGNFYNAEAKTRFLSAYGSFDKHEAIVDNVASVLSALITTSSRKIFPEWAKGVLAKVQDGRLLTSVEKMLERQ